MLKTILVGGIIVSVLCFLMVQNGSHHFTRSQSQYPSRSSSRPKYGPNPDPLCGDLSTTTEPYFRIILSPKYNKSKSMPNDKSRKDSLEDDPLLLNVLNDTLVNSNGISDSDIDSSANSVESLPMPINPNSSETSISISSSTLKPTTKTTFEIISNNSIAKFKPESETITSTSISTENTYLLKDIDIRMESVTPSIPNISLTVAVAFTQKSTLSETTEAFTESSTEISITTTRISASQNQSASLLNILTTTSSTSTPKIPGPGPGPVRFSEAHLTETSTVKIKTESVTESSIDININSQELLPRDSPSTNRNNLVRTTESSQSQSELFESTQLMLEPPSRNYSVEAVTESLLKESRRDFNFTINGGFQNTYLPPPTPELAKSKSDNSPGSISITSKTKTSTPPSRLYLPPKT